ncbi:hypothetical protein BEN47_11815 [Hymenobacter lapidarius]|uniref:Uncharacterized protein n=1 Tax=Hymenobacter lapidarius TaxID=1908237 RepID=A0A1G1T8F6_9BACT|nr:hypothetical protein [Hymenobacter lapidarius]OGX87156.1 hypothetical protein BEN47_11815 [Hymenobacter lapidarius]
MLIAAYTCLPLALQAHVAADLRAEVYAHTAAAPAGYDQQCQELLNALNPVLTWDPAANTLVLSIDGNEVPRHDAVKTALYQPRAHEFDAAGWLLRHRLF